MKLHRFKLNGLTPHGLKIEIKNDLAPAWFICGGSEVLGKTLTMKILRGQHHTLHHGNFICFNGERGNNRGLAVWSVGFDSGHASAKRHRRSIV